MQEREKPPMLFQTPPATPAMLQHVRWKRDQSSHKALGIRGFCKKPKLLTLIYLSYTV